MKGNAQFPPGKGTSAWGGGFKIKGPWSSKRTSSVYPPDSGFPSSGAKTNTDATRDASKNGAQPPSLPTTFLPRRRAWRGATHSHIAEPSAVAAAAAASSSPGPGFRRPAEEHMSPISLKLSQHAIKAESWPSFLGPPLITVLNMTHSTLDLFSLCSQIHHDIMADISAPLTSNIAKSVRGGGGWGGWGAALHRTEPQT